MSVREKQTAAHSRLSSVRRVLPPEAKPISLEPTGEDAGIYSRFYRIQRGEAPRERVGENFIMGDHPLGIAGDGPRDYLVKARRCGWVGDEMVYEHRVKTPYDGNEPDDYGQTDFDVPTTEKVYGESEDPVLEYHVGKRLLELARPNFKIEWLGDVITEAHQLQVSDERLSRNLRSLPNYKAKRVYEFLTHWMKTQEGKRTIQYDFGGGVGKDNENGDSLVIFGPPKVGYVQDKYNVRIADLCKVLGISSLPRPRDTEEAYKLLTLLNSLRIGDELPKFDVLRVNFGIYNYFERSDRLSLDEWRRKIRRRLAFEEKKNVISGEPSDTAPAQPTIVATAVVSPPPKPIEEVKANPATVNPLIEYLNIQPEQTAVAQRAAIAEFLAREGIKIKYQDQVALFTCTRAQVEKTKQLFTKDVADRVEVEARRVIYIDNEPQSTNSPVSVASRPPQLVAEPKAIPPDAGFLELLNAAIHGSQNLNANQVNLTAVLNSLSITVNWKTGEIHCPPAMVEMVNRAIGMICAKTNLHRDRVSVIPVNEPIVTQSAVVENRGPTLSAVPVKNNGNGNGHHGESDPIQTQPPVDAGVIMTELSRICAEKAVEGSAAVQRVVLDYLSKAGVRFDFQHNKVLVSSPSTYRDLLADSGGVFTRIRELVYITKPMKIEVS